MPDAAAPPPGPELNPTQAEVLELLREPRDDRPVHRPDLRDELRSMLHDDLAEVAAWIEQPIRVSKHGLGAVHGCEAQYLDELDRPFEPKPAVIRGTVAHKAVELSVQLPGSSPGRLVDVAVERLGAGNDWAGQWLAEAGELDLAEVRAMASDSVTKFVESFPPLRKGWRPLTESRLSWEAHDGRIRLSGKVDLTVGGADGLRAGKVIIDLKTGRPSPGHHEDLRFYALLETLRLGVPPWKVGGFYLDSGNFVVEPVTEGLLEAAARRVADGVVKMAELIEGGREPIRRPGPACSWCPLLEDCEPGRRARAERDAFG